MAYDKALTATILRQLEHSREQRAAELEEHRYTLAREIPQIAQIDRELRQTSARAMRIAFESNNTDIKIEALKQRNLELQQEKRRLMLAAGYPADYLTLHFDCPICQDTGYADKQLCTCVKRKVVQAQKKALSSLLPIDRETFATFQLDYYSDIPDNNLGCSPRDMARINLRQCQSFSEQFGAAYSNLLLYGSAGLGKTFLSSCIARRVTERGFSVAYDTAIAIFDHCNSVTFGGGDPAASGAALRRYRSADLLIIDDVGTEMPSAFHTASFYDLLNGRFMRRLPIILSTNLLPNQLESRYSPAIASRILGEFTQLRFIGDDIRRLRKRQRM
jgi:DNA replication protein DnaC